MGSARRSRAAPTRSIPTQSITETGAATQVGDLALCQVAPSAHGQALERETAEPHARDLEQGVADEIAGGPQRARPGLGHHHLDPAVLLGRGQPLDRDRLDRTGVEAPAAQEALDLAIAD